MNDFLESLFTGSGFMPHGHCYLWTPGLIWLHVISDSLIVLSYYSIPIGLIYFARKRTDVRFGWMLVCFAAFILACGTTHLFEIWNIWHSLYWLSGIVKAFTALVSLATAFLLVRLIPVALKLPSPALLASANEALEAEILQRRAAENRALELNAELEARVLERTAQYQAANQELEAFSYSVSHDLRAPLRAVNGFSQAALDDYGSVLPSEGQRYLRTIREQAQGMGRLIDDLLTFSRLGRAPLEKQAVNTTALVQSALPVLKPESEDREINVRVGYLAPCSADPVLLKQVWLNLLSNAFKYTRKREGAIVEVGCDHSAAGCTYFVRDNGAGFDMRYAGKLFGVFQRLHRSEDYEGNGVGLALVQRIIHRHGGRVWAEGRIGQGATFYFTLEADPKST